MFLTNSTDLAIVEGSIRISHHQLVQRALSIALISKIAPQSNIAILSENRRGWVYAFYAAWIGKAAVIPIDYMATEKEIAYIISDSNPTTIFVSLKLKDRLETILKTLNLAPTVIVIDDVEDLEVTTINSYSFIPELEDVAVIIYTSGTTGSPKGVMLTYNNLLSNIISVTIDVEILISSDTTLVLLPLHHIFPLLGSMIVPLHLGGIMAFAPSLNPADILNTICQNNVSIIIGVPRLYAAFRKGIMDKIDSSWMAKTLFFIAGTVESYSFSKFLFNAVHKKFGGNIRYMISGGAALDLAVGEDFKTLGFKLLEGFGMTEAAPMIAFSRPDDIIVGSVGKTPSSVIVEIRDGEIVAKGPNIMKGYYNRPEDTNEVIKDGWLYTGDLGHMDCHNNLYITGRKKEIIILSNGKNINPTLVEQEIESKWACIKEIGLFEKNDLLHAIIVPNLAVCSENGIIEIEEYIRHEVVEKYNAQCATYKKIYHLTLVSEELPRTRLGKLQRFKLGQLEDNQEDSSNEELMEENTEELIIIKEYLQKEKKMTIKGRHHIELDLGLDSLEKVSFQVFIESTFGLKMDIAQIIGLESVLELSKYIASHRSKMNVEEINWGEILKKPIELKLPNIWFSSHVIIALSKLIFKLYFKMSGSGRENIPLTPCIIVANHQSYFDGMILASYLSCSQVSRTLYYAKEKHASKLWQKLIAQKHNIIIVDKNKDLRESILMMAEGLKQGKNIVIFPEGTRTRTGQLGVFKKTYAILATELNVPIVPAVIKGSFEALPKGARIPKFNQEISIRYLPPIYQTSSNFDELNHIVRDTILSHL